MDYRTRFGIVILVVEDGAVFRKALADLLRWEGYDAVPAADGHEALELLERGLKPDLILLDMLMPVLDGWRFLTLIQANPILETVPIIVVTGTILTREWAQAHGCSGFVRKPIQVEEFVAEIRRCLAEPNHSEAN